jgi:hypothetical protein
MGERIFGLPVKHASPHTYDEHLEGVRQHNLTAPEHFEVPLTRRRFIQADRRDFSRTRFKITFKGGQLLHPNGTIADTSGKRWNFVFSREGVFLCESKLKTQDRTVSHAVLALNTAVFAAGEVVVADGKVTYIDNRTGAYRLPPVLLDQFLDHLKQQDAIGEEFVLKCHTRDVIFLTATEIQMFREASIPVTASHLALLETGRQQIAEKLARLQNVNQQTERDELLDLQSFFIKVRHLDELTGAVGTAMIAIVENDDLPVPIRVRFLYEFYRNVSYLDVDYVIRELKRIQKKASSSDDRFAVRIAATLDEIASLGPLDV